MSGILSLTRRLRATGFFANYNQTLRILSRRSLCNNGHQKDREQESESKSVNSGAELVDDVAIEDQTRDNEDDGERSDLGHVPIETLLSFSPNGETETGDEGGGEEEEGFDFKSNSREDIRSQASKILEILQQDGPGFNAQQMLDEMQPQVSSLLVREVLFRILISINSLNKFRCAKLAYKFFAWSAEQKNYTHNTNAYNLTIKIFADCEEFKAMWRLLEEMMQKGLPVTARTFNILTYTCVGAGMARKLVERFIMSKTFNYRPFKHSFNAILYSLLTMNQYNLIEWVYQKMLLEGHSPDVLTYNVVMRAKYMLGKLDQFHRLLDEMGKNGFSPDLHTYNLLLHVLGKGDKPLAALNLLNYMSDSGCDPNVLHFTNLIDGLSRAGNLDACKYFFDEMIKRGYEPDVVCYTVMITGYIVAGEYDEAHKLFDEMLKRGHLPNVYTYNSMIRGLCFEGKFDEACSMLKDMDSRGCTPNFSVYSNLVRRLRNAGKVSEANEVINYMLEKGHYIHLVSRFRGYKRS